MQLSKCCAQRHLFVYPARVLTALYRGVNWGPMRGSSLPKATYLVDSRACNKPSASSPSWSSALEGQWWVIALSSKWQKYICNHKPKLKVSLCLLFILGNERIRGSHLVFQVFGKWNTQRWHPHDDLIIVHNPLDSTEVGLVAFAGEENRDRNIIHSTITARTSLVVQW